jgi:IS30 family transposase
VGLQLIVTGRKILQSLQKKLLKRGFEDSQMQNTPPKRSCSTITRELKRNAQSLGYSSQGAGVCAKQRRIQGRASNKLHDTGVLFGVVRYCQGQLDAIADEINNRPPKGLGVRSLLSVYPELLLNSPEHFALIH